MTLIYTFWHHMCVCLTNSIIFHVVIRSLTSWTPDHFNLHVPVGIHSFAACEPDPTETIPLQVRLLMIISSLMIHLGHEHFVGRTLHLSHWLRQCILRSLKYENKQPEISKMLSNLWKNVLNIVPNLKTKQIQQKMTLEKRLKWKNKQTKNNKCIYSQFSINKNSLAMTYKINRASVNLYLNFYLKPGKYGRKTI